MVWILICEDERRAQGASNRPSFPPRVIHIYDGMDTRLVAWREDGCRIGEKGKRGLEDAPSERGAVLRRRYIERGMPMAIPRRLDARLIDESST